MKETEIKLKDLTKELLEKYRNDGLTFSEIADLYDVSKFIILKKSKELGYETTFRNYSKKWSYDINSFDVIDTEEKAYWLGFLYADGYVQYNTMRGDYYIQVGLKTDDYDHLLKFKKFLKDTRDNSVIENKITVKNGKEYKLSRYTVSGKHIAGALVSLGCVPGKSLILKFPNKSIFKKDNIIIDFIRGYIDGDGSLYEKGGKLAISVVGTFNFLSGVKSIFPEFSRVTKRDGESWYKICCSYRKADQVSIKLYGQATVYLDRKFKRFATLCRSYDASEKSGNIGESCDANTEITSEITQGPEVL